jgi:hypothetical protein
VSLTVELLEVRRAVGVAARFPVEDQDRRPKGRHGLPDQREPVGPVIAPTGEKPDPIVLFPNDQSVAVVLDLVDPVGTDRRLRPGSGCRAR